MYIKQVELSHFKSFGGTTQVPLKNGFTVVSGPNGSGKSNILDALLFALGLSSSKGMRADRLPDLVNQGYSSGRRSTLEASVTVTFDISDVPESLLTPEEENESSGPSVPISYAAIDSDLTGSDRPTEADSTDNSSHYSEMGSEGFEILDLEADDQNGAKTQNGSNTLAANGNGTHAPREWTVTRRLRVTPQGTYTSTYFINNDSCTLTQLHDQLQRFRVYPEGYNVVLQGDVTSIISMNPRERRGIIDELAGVASFDRKINQAKEKLEAVREREERFRIVERELTDQRDRLAKDRIKAEKYQRLRQEFQSKTLWELVLTWRQQQQRVQQTEARIVANQQSIAALTQDIQTQTQTISAATSELDRLNTRVKALGEDEQLALQSTLATREAESRQLHRQEQELATTYQDLTLQQERTQRDITEQQQQIEALVVEQHSQGQTLAKLESDRTTAQNDLAHHRQAASEVAAASQAWVNEQTALRHQIEELLSKVEPQRTEQARLQERMSQGTQSAQKQIDALSEIGRQLNDHQQHKEQAETAHQTCIEQVQAIAQRVVAFEAELQIQRDTRDRLLNEQRQKQRQLDKLEAQTQALQETQGTYATKILLQTGLPGVCGLVAQLGRVDSQYQKALEISAGGRLGHLVVEDDQVAAAGIALLKERRAGRATFLPLNKIKAPRLNTTPAWSRPDGFIDYAVNLIDCDRLYRSIFAYVFGNTAVFSDLSTARRSMGQFRIVTLDGELLETSGAMTGGSLSGRQNSLHFGTAEASESAEAIALQQRLEEITAILDRCDGAIAQAQVQLNENTTALDVGRQQQRDAQLTLDRHSQQIDLLTTQQRQLQLQIQEQQHEQEQARGRLAELEQSIPPLEATLQHRRQTLSELETSQTHSKWQQIQNIIREKETHLNEIQLAYRAIEQRLQDLQNQQQRLQERIQQGDQQIQASRTQQRQQLSQQSALKEQQRQLLEQTEALKSQLTTLEQTLAIEKQVRDRAERQLREQQTLQQQQEWQLQKLRDTGEALKADLLSQRSQLDTQTAELPDPLPEIPKELSLESLQQELRSLQKRMQAMEPVNMLALEEHKRTQERLEELSQKLTTLQEERTELLLRIENFTTLRQRAFREAFDAVNENFQTIFAELSDGDGYLQLDDTDDPLSSGLNLIAHPKGKPVRRLASMSGGEKSLTALSFIFALQRYRPSPFYAFDEVDMFLDGANVERLARMIKKQTRQAQFIVVSLRRPMIESSERTIGVTQARGAYTQVLGIELPPQAASV